MIYFVLENNSLEAKIYKKILVRLWWLQLLLKYLKKIYILHELIKNKKNQNALFIL
jgi:hypothetical protein